jgi:hypothetical protein
VLLAVLAGAAAGGCGSDGDESLPAACRPARDSLQAALAAAPRRVELDGTPISACLARSREPGEIQEVGAAYIAVAARLNDAAAAAPEGKDALRLGYLVGAVRRGAEGTQGIHSELLRRLEQEAGPLAAESAAYRRGERAGTRSG